MPETRVLLGEPRPLWLPGPAGRLEGSLRIASPARGSAVLAPPHPLHGGTLHNPVIFHADRELNRAGWTTLRLNFRGVGTSEGVHDEGRGEIDDLAAALAWLRGLSSGTPMLLVGFSFGSWCAIRCAAREPAVAGVVAIGLPVRAYSVDESANLPCPLTVVQAERDEFGEPVEVAATLERLGVPARVFVVTGTSHLFPGRGPDTARSVVEAAEHILPAPPVGGTGDLKRWETT